jgi:hypothetical protein
MVLVNSSSLLSVYKQDSTYCITNCDVPILLMAMVTLQVYQILEQ